MDYLSSDDDFLQPDIFAPYNQEYRGQGVQKKHTNHRIFSPQPIDTQNQQPIQQQNPINTQSFQPIQQQNPIIAHSYQPTRINKKSTFKFFSNAKCSRIITNDNESIPYGWIINNIK